MIRWFTILAAVAGLVLALYTVATARHEAPKVALAAEPSVNPFAHGIAATGIVETVTRNVQIAAPEGGLVTRVFVQVGDRVNVGDPLFELDPRSLNAELVKAKAGRDVAEANLRRVQVQPRPEEIPPVEAEVRALEADVADATEVWERLTQAQKQTAAADYEVRRRFFALQASQARLAQAQARLALLRAGAWSPDVDLAKAQLAEAEASVHAIQALLERRTVRSPIEGTILKRNVNPGEFAAADAKNWAMTVGDLSQLHVRARVDEEDLVRLRSGSHAIARLRGEASITAALTMIRIEPLAQPKIDLSGSTIERVDTRVLEVIFRIEGGGGGGEKMPLYPGQLVDVFIDGPASPERTTATPPPA